MPVTIVQKDIIIEKLSYVSSVLADKLDNPFENLLFQKYSGLVSAVYRTALDQIDYQKLNNECNEVLAKYENAPDSLETQAHKMAVKNIIENTTN